MNSAKVRPVLKRSPGEEYDDPIVGNGAFLGINESHAVSVSIVGDAEVGASIMHGAAQIRR